MGKNRVLATITMVCICFAVVFLMDVPTFLKYKRGDIKDFETVAAHELKKGDLVQGVIDFTDGCIAEMETSNKTFGITTSKETTSRYYAVYMYNEDYILYETGNKSEYATLDRMGEESEAYYNSLMEIYGEDGSGDTTNLLKPSTELPFTGVVKSMPTDLANIFSEWYGEGYESDCEELVIVRSDFTRFSWTVYAGIGAALLGIVMLVITIISWRKEKNAQNFAY